MRDLVAGKRRMIKATEVKHIAVPFFEGLNIELMIAWAKGQPGNVMYAFPIVQREIERLPRAYIANIIYTITGDAFKNWVARQVDLRNAKVAQEADMIEMDSQIAAIY